MMKQLGGWLVIALSSVAVAQPVHMKSAWHPVDELPIAAEAAAKTQAFLYRSFQLDSATLRGNLTAAPLEPARGFHAFAAGQAHSVIDIPMPDGSTQKFAVVETPCMAPELAARHPSIHAFVGESLESPGTNVRCTLTSRGFHAVVLSSSGAVFVNPVAATPTDRTEHYIAFRHEDAADGGMQFDCTVLGEDTQLPEDRAASAASTPLRGTSRNDMTVAYLPTAEWTILHGNSVESALSAMVELTTRLNAIYEQELCVRFIIAAEQDQLIQFDPVTDGLTNSNSSTMLSQAEGVYNRLAPALVCEMRHVLGTYGGGVAYLSSSCTTQAAVTSAALPIENVYTVMVVAHEMGHQFSAAHTFGGAGERCSGNWGVYTEPGGGSTIMSYAQQCYPDNIVSESELQFHAYGLPGMAQRASCGGVVVPLDNNPPDIFISPNLVLKAPLRTPLLLPSVLSDADGDSVTMSWDQINSGSGASLSQGDRGNNPIFRTFLPTASAATRVLPRWETLLNGDPSPGEIVPTRARSALTFRAYARDNRPGGGAVSYQNIAIELGTIANITTFAVLTPQDGMKRSGGPLLVTWAVVNTDKPPFGLANVEIKLMRSDDDRDPIVLVPSTPNDGSEVVELPDTAIERARIIVHPINGVFFDVSRKPFEIIPRTTGPDLRAAGPARLTDTFANGNGNGRIDSGESRIRVYIPAVNAGLATATDSFGTLVSHTPTVRVIVSSAYWPTVTPGALAENEVPFVIEVSPDHPCGSPIDLECTLLPGSPFESHTAFQLPVGNTSSLASTQMTYSGPPVLIPDGDTNGVSIPLSVPSLPGPLTDVKLRILGQVSIDPNRADAGINHPYVGDLVIRLTNPQGATITIADRPGDVGNFGKNFCQTLFDMKQIGSYIQSAIPRRAPYDGVFLPKESLNLLAGGSGVGNWTLWVADMRTGQATEPAPTLPPAVRQFRLELTCQLPPACAAAKPYCEGDLNLDGFVNDADFVVFVAAYDALFNSTGDLDGDTLTTDADFSLFVRGYDQLLCP